MLGIEQTVRFQLGDGLLALTSQVADGVFWVDTNDRKTESIDSMVLHLRLHQYRHAGLQTLTCLGLEIRHQQFLRSCPTRRAYLGLLTFGKFHIQMPAFLAQATYLRLHPITRRQSFAQHLAYLSAQFR